MALSGSTDFGLTRDQLITASLQEIGAIGDGDTPTPTQLSESNTLLNMLIKNWATDGMQLWMRYYGYIFPIHNTNLVQLGAEGGKAATSYTYTQTSATSSSGATTITVDSITGISTTNIIGVEQSDGTMHWTTVNGAPAGSTVTLTAALTSDVTVDAAVYVYATTAALKRPNRILEAFRRESSSNIDTPMTQITNQEYNRLPAKTEEGTVIQWHYDLPLNMSTSGYPGNGDFYFWPRHSDGKYVIVIKYIKHFDDLDVAGNNPEFPQEWFLPLMKGLSWLLAAKNSVPYQERKILMEEANMLKNLALDHDVEMGSLFIQPRIKQ
jgi:hypothetical protein